MALFGKAVQRGQPIASILPALWRTHICVPAGASGSARVGFPFTSRKQYASPPASREEIYFVSKSSDVEHAGDVDPDAPEYKPAIPVERWQHSNREIQSLLSRAAMVLQENTDGSHIETDIKQSSSPHLSENIEYYAQGQGLGVGGRHLFTNSYVNMSKVRAIGFDYDYTLVTYSTDLQRLIYNEASKFMRHVLQYPVKVMSRSFDPQFAIRGLAVDTRTGALLKLNYLGVIAVSCVFVGRHQCTEAEVQEMYGEDYTISMQYRKTYIKPLNDLFTLAEACLVADTIQGLRDQNLSFDPSAVVSDVQAGIENTHSMRVMHDAVMSNVEKYVHATPKIRGFLTSLRDSGKKLFLASNSDFRFVSCGMRYIVGDDWKDLFDIVVVSARKPAFYNSCKPFRGIDSLTGRVKWKRENELYPNALYEGGSIAALQELTGWKGHDVLYFGDSIFADLVEARREYGWYTGAIINELGHELDIVSQESYGRLAYASTVLEELLRLVQDAIYESADNEEGQLTSEDEALVQELEEEIEIVKSKMKAIFNDRFGSVFRTETAPTQVGPMHHIEIDTTDSSTGLQQSAFVHCALYTYSPVRVRKPVYPPRQCALQCETTAPTQIYSCTTRNGSNGQYQCSIYFV
eukprot:m.96857 g.96857  ORF g.96857 m.96857 type:complete len:633 (-) comp16675_c0_seq1:476-2374(-)